MAQRKDTTNLSGLLFQFMGTEDPMLNMLEWLCEQMMEVEISNKIGADNTSKVKREQVTVAGSGHDDWIPGWARCTSWCPRSEAAAISPSL